MGRTNEASAERACQGSENDRPYRCPQVARSCPPARTGRRGHARRVFLIGLAPGRRSVGAERRRRRGGLRHRSPTAEGGFNSLSRKTEPNRQGWFPALIFIDRSRKLERSDQCEEQTQAPNLSQGTQDHIQITSHRPFDVRPQISSPVVQVGRQRHNSGLYIHVKIRRQASKQRGRYTQWDCYSIRE